MMFDSATTPENDKTGNDIVFSHIDVKVCEQRVLKRGKKVQYTLELVCVATQCRCTALELNHSVGGNCAEKVLIARVCLLRPLRLNKRESRDTFSETRGTHLELSW